MQAQLSAHDVRRVAVLAAVDPRTVARYLRGERVASTCASRIGQALADVAPSLVAVGAQARELANLETQAADLRALVMRRDLDGAPCEAEALQLAGIVDAIDRIRARASK